MGDRPLFSSCGPSSQGSTEEGSVRLGTSRQPEEVRPCGRSALAKVTRWWQPGERWLPEQPSALSSKWGVVAKAPTSGLDKTVRVFSVWFGPELFAVNISHSLLLTYTTCSHHPGTVTLHAGVGGKHTKTQSLNIHADWEGLCE